VRPIALRLNARLVKQHGKISEQVYKSSGLHDPATDNIIKWLEKAKKVTETAQQLEALTLLIKFYKTGDLNVWDEYAVAWTNITEGLVD
jgi:dipeptidyl-peptidase-3